MYTGTYEIEQMQNVAGMYLSYVILSNSVIPSIFLACDSEYPDLPSNGRFVKKAALVPERLLSGCLKGD